LYPHKLCIKKGIVHKNEVFKEKYQYLPFSSQPAIPEEDKDKAKTKCAEAVSD